MLSNCATLHYICDDFSNISEVTDFNFCICDRFEVSLKAFLKKYYFLKNCPILGWEYLGATLPVVG